jgi:hypothetical protein
VDDPLAALLNDVEDLDKAGFWIVSRWFLDGFWMVSG